MRILVCGAHGLLGKTLVPVLISTGHDVIQHGNKSPSQVSCDLTDEAATILLLKEVAPDCIINLVALTDVDRCERDIHAAYLLNVKTVENIVAGMQSLPNAHLVHISTDQLYDASGPSIETGVRIINNYALTKYAGELATKLVSSTVLRTNFFGPSLSPSRISFSDWLLDCLINEKPITVFSDVFFNPLHMSTLAEMINRVANDRVSGIFNLGSRGTISKADFAFELARLHNLSPKSIARGVSGDVKQFAPRPKDMTMDCGCFEGAFNVVLPSIEQEIQKVKRL